MLTRAPGHHLPVIVVQWCLRLLIQALVVTGVYVSVLVLGRYVADVTTLVAASTVVVALGYPAIASASASVTWRLLFGRRPAGHQALRDVIDHAVDAASGTQALDQVRATVAAATGASEVTIGDDGIILGGAAPSPSVSHLVEALTPGVQVMVRNAALQRDVTAALERSEARLAEVSAARQRLLTAAQSQRARMEREINRYVVPPLAQMITGLDDVSDRLRDGRDPGELITPLRAMAAHALTETRAAAWRLYPPVLRDLGLGPALQAYAQKRPATTVTVSGLDRLDPTLELTLHTCCFDLLDHVTGPAQIDLTAGEQITLTLRLPHPPSEDDLSPIRDRVTALGGHLTTTPGSVRLELPR